MLHVSNPINFQDMVLLLQLDSEEVEMPFVSDAGRLTVNARQPTRALLEGLLIAIAAIAPPHQYWSESHNDKVTDYLWCAGAHPFEPFGSGERVSQLLEGVSRRNLLLLQLNTALLLTKDAIQQLDDFVNTRVRDPFEADVDHAKNARSWIDNLYHKVRE